MAISLARYNFFISLELLKILVAKGVKYFVLCPGSRSGPLALAAASLSKRKELTLITSIDERSAAFLALGISAASGQVSCVITTSGSAVANLLPAAVEADRSCHSLLFLTADRPLRLKECGANQAVNQQDFLKSVCRHFDESPKEGIHLISKERLTSLVGKSFEMASNIPGPVHINLAYEEPLHPCEIDQNKVLDGWGIEGFLEEKITLNKVEGIKSFLSLKLPKLDPFSLGISAASGQVSAVITTSGSAVANLLPAAVEADRSCHSLLFLTADRPLRLKECGANQAVNQEDFLKSVCRHFDESPKEEFI